MSEWTFQKWDKQLGYQPCSAEEAEREAEKALLATNQYVYVAVNGEQRYDAVHVVRCLKDGLDPITARWKGLSRE